MRSSGLGGQRHCVLIFRSLALLGLGIAASVTSVMADRAPDEDPVLRLRLEAPGPAPALPVAFRGRMAVESAAPAPIVPMPDVNLADAGRVGTFAYLATPHPNFVVALGATEDRSELGRQADRAMMVNSFDQTFYDQQHDRTPFVGLGFRTAPDPRGWSMDASIGAGLVNTPEHSRLSDSIVTEQSARFEAEARANFRVRYSF